MKTREAVGPVQVAPPGLSNMLQLKTQGFNPDALNQDIQPTIDLEAWWLRATQKVEPAGYAAQYVGGASLGSVLPLLDSLTSTVALGPPVRNWWYVHAVSVRAFANVGASSNVALGFRVPGGIATWSDFILSDMIDCPVNEYQLFTARGLWLPPLAQIGVFIDFVPALASLDLNLAGLLYTELPL